MSGHLVSLGLLAVIVGLAVLLVIEIRDRRRADRDADKADNQRIELAKRLRACEAQLGKAEAYIAGVRRGRELTAISPRQAQVTPSGPYEGVTRRAYPDPKLTRTAATAVIPKHAEVT